MDFSVFVSAPIAILCLIVGFIIKHLISDETVQNKYIPVIVTILGIIVSVILTVCGGGVITAEGILTAVICGGISGAASTGFQSAFAAFIEKPSITESKDDDEADEAEHMAETEAVG